MVLIWNAYRRCNGSIDLVAAFRARIATDANSRAVLRAIGFLAEIEELSPIHSVQSAAIAIAHAMDIATY